MQLQRTQPDWIKILKYLMKNKYAEIKCGKVNRDMDPQFVKLLLRDFRENASKQPPEYILLF